MDWNKANGRVSSTWLAVVALLLVPVFAWGRQDTNHGQKPEHPAHERQVQQSRPQPQARQSSPQGEARESRPQGRPEIRGQQPQVRGQGQPQSPNHGNYGRQQPQVQEGRSMGRPETRGQQPQVQEQGQSPSPGTYGRQPQPRQENVRLPGPGNAAPPRNVSRPGQPAPAQPRTAINQPRTTQPGRSANARPPVVLQPRESSRHIEDLNRGRRGMAGINARNLPRGQVSVASNGRQTIRTQDGRRIVVRPNRTVARVQMPDGRVAAFRANGRIRSFRTANNSLVVQHGLRGDRRIVTVGPRGDRVVSFGPRRGYYERPYAHGYYQRTYWAGGRPYARIYRPYRWHNTVYYQYVSVRYYHPAFYGWAYRPWPGRVYYRWGWYSVRPAWYGYYGPYFAPSPWYLTASLWLTDFLIAEELQAAWQARQDALAAAAAQQSAEYAPPPAAAPPTDEPPPADYQQQGQPSAAVTLTPEVKQLIADEVQRQLQAQQAAAANPQQEASAPQGDQSPLDPSQQVFIVSNNLDTTANGQECELTAGDVLYRIGDAPSENQTITMKVTSSKAADCPVRSNVEIAVEDLQEMQNDFRAQIDNGMDNLAKDQGQGGMPAAPDTSSSPSGAPAPSPDSANLVQDQLQQQQSAADQAEAQVEQQAIEDQSAQGNPQ